MMTLPIGIDDFRELRMRNKYYIDKTLMIRDFIQYDYTVALITRPRRFGKTLNMTMLREFFDITKESKSIFEGLAIMETEYANLINTKPVIYLTFENCSGATMVKIPNEEVKKEFREIVTTYTRVSPNQLEDVEEIFVDEYGMVGEKESIINSRKIPPNRV